MKKKIVEVSVLVMTAILVIGTAGMGMAFLGTAEDFQGDEVILVEADEADVQRYGDVIVDYGRNVLMRTNKDGIEVLEKQYNIDYLEHRSQLNVKGHIFDTREDLNFQIESLEEGSEGIHIVDMIGPVHPEWRRRLEEAGAEVLNYQRHYAYEVMMTPEIAEKVENFEFVEWVGVYQPEFKLNENIDEALESGKSFEVLLRPGFDRSSLRMINRDVDVVREVDMRDRGYKMIVDADSIFELEDLAMMNDVYYISPYFEPQLHGETEAQLTGGGLWFMDDEHDDPDIPYRKHGDFGSYMNQIGYSGEGVITAVADTGIGDGTVGDSGHSDFTGRVIGGWSFDDFDPDYWGDGHYHGTSVSGLIAGDTHLGTGETMSFADYYMGQAQGYLSELWALKIFDDNAFFIGPDDYFEILEEAAQRSDAYVHSNSWGGPPGGGAYGDLDSAYDEAVRDADRDTDENHPMAISNSAGNAGPGDNTIGSPGAAKNVITVGGNTPYNPDTGFSNPENMYFLSSRGWTNDNRVKPDVIAPATGVYSQDTPQLVPDGYRSVSGTSFSEPIINAAMTIIIEWYEEHHGETPSPAMIRNLIINTARQLDPDEGDTRGYRPNQDEGWGVPDVSRLHYPLDDPVGYVLEDQEILMETGDEVEYDVAYMEDDEPLKITLTWTDKYALPGDDPTLKNNLDLEVETPTGEIIRGNAFDLSGDGMSDDGYTYPDAEVMADFDYSGDGWDDVNNVNNVFIHPDELEEGIYTIRVIGTNVPEDANFDGDANQDFALSVYNAAEDPAIDLERPVGGEFWQTNAEEEILWSTTEGAGAIEEIDLEYTLDGGDTWEYIVEGYDDTGEYLWTVPDETTTEAMIRATVYDEFEGFGQDTSGLFTITDVAPPEVDLIVPDGGEVWNAGDEEEIVWQSTEGDEPIVSVDLEYSTDGGNSWEYIVEDIDDTGSYIWEIPDETSSMSLVRVWVHCEGETSAFDTSTEYFDLVGIPPQPPRNLDVEYWSLEENIFFYDDVSEDKGYETWVSHDQASEWGIRDHGSTVGDQSWDWGDGQFNKVGDFGMESRLYSPEIEIPEDAENVELTFDHWRDFGDAAMFDGGNLRIAPVGESFEIIEPEEGYDGIISDFWGNPLGGEPAWGGIHDWEVATFDLSDYTGETIQLRWNAGTEAWVGLEGEGWRIDNIEILEETPTGTDHNRLTWDAAPGDRAEGTSSSNGNIDASFEAQRTKPEAREGMSPESMPASMVQGMNRHNPNAAQAYLEDQEYWHWQYLSEWRFTPDNAIGLTAPGDWYGAITMDLSDYAGQYITEIAYHDYEEAGDWAYGLIGIDDDGAPADPWLAETEMYEPEGAGWVELELENPVLIEEGEIYWIAMYLDDYGDGNFPFAVDDAFPDETQWINLGNPHIPGNWDDLEALLPTAGGWAIETKVMPMDVYFDVEIIDYDEQVQPGETVEVEYTVVNLGEEQGTQDISFYVEDEFEDVEPEITLGPGDVFEGEFSWETDEDDKYMYHKLTVSSEDTSDTVEVLVGDEPKEVSHYNIYRAVSEDGPWDEETFIAEVEADGSDSYEYIDEGKGEADPTAWWYVVRSVSTEGVEEKNTDAVQEPVPEPGAYELMGYYMESYDGEAKFYDGEEYSGNITVVDHAIPDNMAVNYGFGGDWIDPYGTFAWDATYHPGGWSMSQPYQGNDVYFINEIPQEEVEGDAGYVWTAVRKVEGHFVAYPQASMVGQYEPLPTPQESEVGAEHVVIEVESPAYTDWDGVEEESPSMGTYDEFVSYSVFIKGGDYHEWTHLGNTESIPEEEYHGEYDDPIRPYEDDIDPETVTTGMNRFDTSEVTDLLPDETYEFKVRMNTGEGLHGGYAGGFDDAYTTYSSGEAIEITTEKPDAPIWLRIEKHGNPGDLHLEWQDVGADAYNVYYSHNQYKDLDDSWTKITTVYDNEYTHTGSLGGNNFYFVRAVYRGVESTNSIMAFCVERHFDDERPRHYISVPMGFEDRTGDGRLRASDLVMDIEGDLETSEYISDVVKWDHVERGHTEKFYYDYVAGEWVNDFDIEPGDGIGLYVENEFTWHIAGTDTEHDIHYEASSSRHYTSIPYTMKDYTESGNLMASDIVEAIEGDQETSEYIFDVVKWDYMERGYSERYYYDQLSGEWSNDFEIKAGDGIGLGVHNAFTWSPELIIPDTREHHELIIEAAPEEGGTTYPEPGVYTILTGTRLTLEAFPEDGWVFANWTGDYESYEEVIELQIYDDMVLTANFLELFDLTIEVDPEEGGTTVPEPGTYTFVDGTEVTISALPELGWEFSHWTGDVPEDDLMYGDVGYAFDVFPGDDSLWFPLDNPGDLNYIAPNQAMDFIAGATWYDDTWYGSEFNGGLWTIDEETGDMEFIGNTPAFNGLAYDDYTDTMYGATGDQLYTVDPYDASTELVGGFGVPYSVIGIASDGEGNLYGNTVDFTADSQLYSIDPDTGEATLIGDTGLQLLFAQDMAFDKEAGILYQAAYFGDATMSGLYELCIDTAEPTHIGDFPADEEIAGFTIPYDIVGDEIIIVMDSDKHITAHFEELDAFFEVEITDHDELVLEEDEVEVEYEVTNTDAFEDTQDIEFSVYDENDEVVYYDVYEDLYLGPGDTHMGTFVWQTEEGDAGEYMLEVASIEDYDTVWTTVVDEEFELTINVEPDEGGTTDPEPGTYTFLDGEEVTVEAISELGWKFSHWSGDIHGTTGHELMDEHIGYAFDVFPGDDSLWFPLDDPGDLNYIAPNQAMDFIAGATWYDDTWYGVEFNGGLWTIDEETGDMEFIGNTPAFNGLAYDDSTDTMYGATGDQLFTVDPYDASTELVGGFGAPYTVIGIASDGEGNLYGNTVDFTADSELYSIDTDTGEATLIGDTGLQLLFAQDMAFDKGAGILYQAAYFGDATMSGLYELCIDTAEPTHIGDFPADEEIAGFAIPSIPVDEEMPVMTLVMDQDREITAHFEEDTALFEVEIVDHDELVAEGNEVTVEYEITNTDAFEDTQDIEYMVYFEIDGTIYVIEWEKEELTLEANEVYEGEFIWQTEEGDSELAPDGEYTIKIESEEDYDTAWVTVVEHEYDLTINVDPEEGGTTIPEPGTHTYPETKVVNIEPIPEDGWEFSHWSGDVPELESGNVDVAVLDTGPEPWHDGEVFVDILEEKLGTGYNIVLETDWDDFMDNIEDYDTIVVQRISGTAFAPDPVRANAFFDAVTEEQGLIVMDSWGGGSGYADGVICMEEATGDPINPHGSIGLGHPVDVEITQDHAIFDGVGSVGDVVNLYDADRAFWFDGFVDEDYEIVGDVSVDGIIEGHGFAVNEGRNEIVLSTMGQTSETWATKDYTEEAKTLLANAVEFVSDTDTLTLVMDSDIEVTAHFIEKTAFFETTITDHDELVEEGDEVNVEYEITNIDDFEETQDIDFTVYDEDDEVVYSDVYEDLTLEPNEVYTGTFVWQTGSCYKGEYMLEVASYNDYDTAWTTVVEQIYELTINVEPEEGGTTYPEPGTHVYVEDAEVTVEAIPEDYWEFVEWTGDFESDDETITIVMDDDYEITAHFEMLDVEIVFYDDVSEDKGYETTGEVNTWDIRDHDSVVGDYSWDWGDGDYEKVGELSSLISPEIELPDDADTIEFTFQHWRDIADTWDGVNIKISVNGGDFELIEDPVPEYDHTIGSGFDNPIEGEDAWGGTVDWEEVFVDLSEYAGDTIQLRWDAGVEDWTGGAEGWRIDDIEIVAFMSNGDNDQEMELHAETDVDMIKTSNLVELNDRLRFYQTW